MDDPVVLLEKNLYGHPLAGLLWERQLEKAINWERLLVDRARELFLPVYVDDVKLGGASRFRFEKTEVVTSSN